MSNYHDLMRIANETVRQSKGLGYNFLDRDKVILSVERASRMAALSERCRTLASEQSTLLQKVRAAMVLGVDASEYEREYNLARAEYERVSTKVDEVVSNYTKDYYGNWRIPVDAPVAI